MVRAEYGWRVLGWLRPTKHGANSSQQFIRSEGLREVVVGPHVKSADLVTLVAPRADDDDGRLLTMLHLLEHAPSIDEGQPDIEQYRVGLRRRLKRLHSLRAVEGLGDVETGRGERPDDRLAQSAVVLDNEDVALSHGRANRRMANPVFEAARTVLSVRDYLDKPVPASMNGQPWHFVVAHEKDSPYGVSDPGLPIRYDVLAVVPFGYPARPVKGIKKRKPFNRVASAERFGTPLS